MSMVLAPMILKIQNKMKQNNNNNNKKHDSERKQAG